MRIWLYEAHSKRDGLIKLTAAFIIAPVVASFSWALLQLPVALFFLPEEYSAGKEYTLAGAYMHMALVNCKTAFVIGAPSFVVMLLLMRKLALYNLTRLCLFASAIPIALACAWNLYQILIDGIQSITAVGVFVGALFMTGVLGGVGGIIAASVAFIFWFLGIKNNFWLLNHFAPANP